MANTKVEILGGTLDGAVLSNAASEATLQELVRAINGMTGSRAGRGGGPSGSNGGGGGLNSLKQQQEALEKQTSSLGKMFKGATNAAAGLAGQMVSGKSSMSKMADVINDNLIRNIPIVGNALATLGDIVVGTVKTLEEWNAQLKVSNTYGAAFNNNLFELKIAATKSYMELDEFVGMVSESRKELVGLGGTVTKGALAFAEISQEINKSGGFGQQLTDMGWSTERINKAVLKYATTTGMNIKNASQQAESAVRYSLTLDKLTKLTGQSAQEQEDAMASVKQDAIYQIKRNQLDADGREKMDRGLAEFTARYGKAGAEYYKSVVVGVKGQTESQRIFMSTMGGAAQVADDLVAAARDKSISAKNYEELTNKKMVDALMSTIKGYGSMEALLAAASAGTDGTAQAIYEAYGPVLTQLAKYGDVTKMSREQLEAAIISAKTEQTAVDATTVSLNRFDKDVERIGKNIKLFFVESLYSIVDGISGAFTTISNVMAKFSKYMDQLINTILLPFVRDFPKMWDKLTDGSMIDALSNKLSDMFEDVMLAIKKKMWMISDAEYEAQSKKNAEARAKRDQQPAVPAAPAPLPQVTVPSGTGQGTTGAVGGQSAARASVEKYLGRKLSDTEYDQLIRATHAEAQVGKGADQREQALIMASILNRARAIKGDDSVIKALNAKNAFQSVTGTRANNHMPSEGFLKGPNASRLQSIEGSTSFLDKIGTDQKDFTAANRAAYGPGTSQRYLDDMTRGGGKVYGGTMFRNAPQFSTGTLGVLGKTFGDFGEGTPAMLHGREAVMTEGQYNTTIQNTAKMAAGAMMGSGEGNQNGLADLLSTLNTSIAELININKNALDVHNRQLRATQGLSGDLFQIA